MKSISSGMACEPPLVQLNYRVIIYPSLGLVAGKENSRKWSGIIASSTMIFHSSNGKAGREREMEVETWVHYKEMRVDPREKHKWGKCQEWLFAFRETKRWEGGGGGAFNWSTHTTFNITFPLRNVKHNEGHSHRRHLRVFAVVAGGPAKVFGWEIDTTQVYSLIQVARFQQHRKL